MCNLQPDLPGESHCTAEEELGELSTTRQTVLNECLGIKYLKSEYRPINTQQCPVRFLQKAK